MMRKIKIAYIMDTIKLPIGGTEKQLLLLLKHIDRIRFDPYLFCLQSSGWLKQKFDLSALHILGIYSFKSPVLIFNIWAFSRFLKKNKFEIIQTQFRDSNYVGIIAAKLAGIKSIISTRRGVPFWKNKTELLILRRLNKWVDRFVTNSYSTKKWVMESEKVPEEKIQVIHNGVDFEPFNDITPETREGYRKLLNIQDSSPVIGVIANLRPVKGLDVFLKTAKVVKKRIPDARFIVVGDGNEKDDLMTMTNKFGLGDCVNFLGGRDDVVRLLSAFDIGVLSSNSESLSNAIIEYIAAGLPVVCTDVGGNSELVQDGLNGFLVPPGDPGRLADAIVKLVNYPDLRLKMGRESRQRAELLFDFARTMKDYEALYLNMTS